MPVILGVGRSERHRPTRVAHVITTLDVGGAERALQHLVESTQEGTCSHVVVSLTSHGPVADAVRRAGWEVRALDMRRPLPAVRAPSALRSLLRAEAPDVVHTWMVHANLLGGLVAATTRTPVVWSLHHDQLAPGRSSARTRAVEGLNSRLARRLPARVVCTSESSRSAAVARGYPADRLVVIPNGVPVLSAPADRASARRALGLPVDGVLVGRVARLAEQKDHETFFSALAHLRSEQPEVRAVLAGRGLVEGDRALRRRLDRWGLHDTILLGEEQEVGAVHMALDVEVSSSAFGETTPLVLSEAMSLGVPVVSTDVGDCAAMVDGVGWVVPPRDPVRLAAAVGQALAAPPSERARRAALGVQRVQERYSSAAMARRYEQVYAEASALSAVGG